MNKFRMLALVAATQLASCASLMTGEADTVTVKSVPTNSYFQTNIGVSGRTPFDVEVPASQDLVVTIQRDGFEPMTKTVPSRLSGWIVGNLLFGGGIGIIVDLVNPNARTHDRSVTLRLQPGEHSARVASRPRRREVEVRSMPREIRID